MLTALPHTYARLSRILGISTSWNPEGFSRPVTGTTFATLLLLILTGRLALFVFHYSLFLCSVAVFSLDRHVTEGPEALFYSSISLCVDKIF